MNPNLNIMTTKLGIIVPKSGEWVPRTPPNPQVENVGEGRLFYAYGTFDKT